MCKPVSSLDREGIQDFMHPHTCICRSCGGGKSPGFQNKTIDLEPLSTPAHGGIKQCLNNDSGIFPPSSIDAPSFGRRNLASWVGEESPHCHSPLLRVQAGGELATRPQRCSFSQVSQSPSKGVLQLPCDSLQLRAGMQVKSLLVVWKAFSNSYLGFQSNTRIT